jgi:hypothetical protein
LTVTLPFMGKNLLISLETYIPFSDVSDIAEEIFNKNVTIMHQLHYDPQYIDHII